MSEFMTGSVVSKTQENEMIMCLGSLSPQNHDRRRINGEIFLCHEVKLGGREKHLCYQDFFLNFT